MSLHAEPANLGLRERKKRLVMDHLQAVALDLFETHGYANVTIEQVAEAAGVSPSTVYRHFGTKDRLVLHDEIDRLMVAGVVDRFPELDLVDAARAVLAVLAPMLTAENRDMLRRLRHMVDEPAVHAAMLGEMHQSVVRLAEILVERSGGALDRVEATTAAQAMVGALLASVEEWRAQDFAGNFADIMERALATLERGLRARQAPAGDAGPGSGRRARGAPDA